MKHTLDLMTKIRKALGGEKCEVVFMTTEFGLEVRVHWYDGSDYNVARRYTYSNLEHADGTTDIMVNDFILWAGDMKSRAK